MNVWYLNRKLLLPGSVFKQLLTKTTIYAINVIMIAMLFFYGNQAINGFIKPQ